MRSILRILIRKEDCATTLVFCPLPPAWIRQELCGRHPRQGGEGRRGELKEIALPSPPDRGEEDGAEAGRMTDSPRRCPVAAGRCRSVAMCGDGIAQKRTRRPLFLSSWLLVRWWRRGERLAMVWTVRTSDGAEEKRGTGEDGGGILCPGPLSLPSPFLLLFFLYI